MIIKHLLAPYYKMADEIAALKQLQAGLNASFEAVYAAKDVKSLTAAKEGLVGLSHATAGTALGPVFSIMSLTGMVRRADHLIISYYGN